jgi:hypothetical protein
MKSTKNKLTVEKRTVAKLQVNIIRYQETASTVSTNNGCEL